MTLPTISYLDEQGNLPAGYQAQINPEKLVQGYRIMVLARLVDERMITLQRQGLITFAMSALGEEACAVASSAALEPGDWIYPQYREAGALFWRGFKIIQYVHHMFGDREDLILGRQMPNHFGSKELNVVTVSSPIATQIPQAAGCAYAMKLQREQAVTLCYFGEGATSEGDFHAGVNFAAVRKAPAIFFCRNNRYAISTKCERQYAGPGVAEKGVGYGVQAFRIDGNDFFAVYDTVSKARQICLAGKGPILIEAMTYRLGAHSTSDDPSVYRSDEEVAKWTEKCPVLRLRRYLEKQGLWNEEQEKKLHAEIQDEIQVAITAAKSTPRSPLHYIVEHVYFNVSPALKQQYEQLKQLYPHEG